MDDGRNNQRTSRLMRGSITLASNRTHDVLIQNVSSRGIGIKFSDMTLKAGEAVRIDIAALGVFHGVVRWHANGRAGIELTEELDPAAAHFANSELSVKENHKFKVAARFQPATSIYRPGFGKK